MNNTENNNSSQDQEDNFANDPEVQEWRRIEAEYDSLIRGCVEILFRDLTLEEIDEEPDLSSFELLKSVKIVDYSLYGSTKEQLPVQVFVCEYHWEHNSYRNHASGNDHCLFGILRLSKEHPLTYVYKEALTEKIVDWFIKGDVDFEDQKLFSRQFHVVTKDKEKLKLLWGNKLLDELAAFPGMELEISGNNCLYRNFKKPITPELTKEFVDLTKALFKIFK